MLLSSDKVLLSLSAKKYYQWLYKLKLISCGCLSTFSLLHDVHAIICTDARTTSVCYSTLPQSYKVKARKVLPG